MKVERYWGAARITDEVDRGGLFWNVNNEERLAPSLERSGRWGPSKCGIPTFGYLSLRRDSSEADLLSLRGASMQAGYLTLCGASSWLTNSVCRPRLKKTTYFYQLTPPPPSPKTMFCVTCFIVPGNSWRAMEGLHTLSEIMYIFLSLFF